MAVFLIKSTASEAFHVVGASGEPAFFNGGNCVWRNPLPGELLPNINPTSFHKDADGIVHLRGVPVAFDRPGFTCGSGTPLDLVIFQLPAGYQPEHVEIFPSGNTSIQVNLIAPVGGVTLGGTFIPGGSVFVVNITDGNATTLDGFTFRAAPAATASSPARAPVSISLEALRELLGRGSTSRPANGKH